MSTDQINALLQLWTAVAVSLGASIAFFTYRQTKRLAVIGHPTVLVDQTNSGSFQYISLRFSVSKEHADAWSINQIALISPSDAMIGRGVYDPDGAGGRKFVGFEGVDGPYGVDPPSSQVSLILEPGSSAISELKIRLVLNSDPQITSRFTKRIKRTI